MLRDHLILMFSLLFFIMSSFFLYWFAPDKGVHFVIDSFRYDFLAQHFVKELPLEVLGYPFFLRIIYHLFGYSIGSVVGIQVLLSIAVLFLLRKIVYVLIGKESQIVITILWAGNLGFLIYSQIFLIEIVLTLLYLGFVERCISFYEKPSFFTITQAALILSVSILFRPAAIFYALCFAPFLLFIHKETFLYRLKASVLFIVIFYMPLLLYMTANYWMFKKFILCPVMNVNLFLFFYPRLIAGCCSGERSFSHLVHAIDMDVAQNNITLKTQINLVKLILVYPFFALKIWLFNMIKSCVGLYQVEWKIFFERCNQCTSFFNLSGSLWSNMKSYIEQGTEKYWLYVLGWYEVGYLLIEYLFAIIGSCWLLLRKKIWLFFFAASFITYFVLVTGPDGSGRFRMMIEPWLLILASLGLTFILSYKKQKIKAGF